MTDKSNDTRMKTGTTTVGVLSEDAVVLAADKRSTLGGKIVHSRTADKITTVNGKAVMTHSGTVSTIQLVHKMLKAQIRLKELDAGRELRVSEIAQLLVSTNFRNARSPRPEIAHWLLGGYDTEPHLFDVMPDGAVSEAPRSDGYFASGSGMMFALSVLEDGYDEELSQEDATSLAIRAVRAATKRDTASGNGIDVFVVDKDGARQVEKQVIKTVVE